MKTFGVIVMTVIVANICSASEKKASERKPASPGSFLCVDPLAANTANSVQNSLNWYCDNSKSFSVTYVSGSGYLVCCVQKIEKAEKPD